MGQRRLEDHSKIAQGTAGVGASLGRNFAVVELGVGTGADLAGTVEVEPVEIVVVVGVAAVGVAQRKIVQGTVDLGRAVGQMHIDWPLQQ